MYKFQFVPKTIRTNQDAEEMRNAFLSTKNNIIAASFDTEATGLNPVLDKPFLYQFGWINITDKTIYTFAVDIEQQPKLAHQVIRVWQTLVKCVAVYCGHHVIFDLHMVTNIGLPYEHTNITDTMAYIRLGNDAIQEDKGGVPLALKKFAKRYISNDADADEKELDALKSKITSEYNNALKKALGWTKKKIDKFFKDSLNEVEDLPQDKQIPYLLWKAELPKYLQDKVTGAVESDMIRYDHLDRDTVVKYGHVDIRLTLEVWYLMNEMMKVRDNWEALRIENENIYPVYRMERVGFCIDKPYLMEAKKNVKHYIRTRREDLVRLAGQPISIGQHAQISDILAGMGCVVESTGKEVLERVVSDLKHKQDNPTALEFIETLQELRTMEKWYATYICRFLYDLLHHDRVYTSIKAYHPVSGRVSCDFQQFPKKAIKTIDGVELFHPRRMVKVTPGYKGIIYLDYSQVELRLQAMYTILVGTPDTNLCRAYMPYQCHTVSQEGVIIPFNYEDKWCIEHSYDIAWYYDEEPTKKWEPLDVHGATTKAAFDIDEDNPEYHDLRYVGKRVNFAKNYGAQRGKIAQMFPEFDDERITKIDGAYYKAFPGVKAYHNYCYAIANQPYAVNLFGTKYWGVSGHNLINTLVQGSGAYLLKMMINKVDAYLQELGCKSRFQMEIHDELSFEWHPDDPPEIWFTVKGILQSWTDAYVPIVSDMEVTYTNWAEKVEVKNIEQLNTQTV